MLKIGNRTECALLELARKLGADYQKLRDANHTVQVLTFSWLTSLSDVASKLVEGCTLLHHLLRRLTPILVLSMPTGAAPCAFVSVVQVPHLLLKFVVLSYCCWKPSVQPNCFRSSPSLRTASA